MVLGFWLLAVSARAAPLCGRATALKAPLLDGFVGAAGSPRRAPLRSGRFCVKAGADDALELWIPPGRQTLPLRRLREPDAFEAVAQASARATAELSGRLCFDGDAPVEDGLAGYIQMADGYQTFFLIGEAGQDRCATWSARVTPEGVKTAALLSEKWQVRWLDPPLSVKDKAEALPFKFPAGKQTAVAWRAGPAVPVRAKIGESWTEGERAGVELKALANRQELWLFADQEGRAEGRATPGLWQVLPVWTSEKADWGVDESLQARWLAIGETLELEFPVSPGGRVVVEGGPPPGGSYWTVGVPRGAPGSALLSEDGAVFSFGRETDGSWQPLGYGRGGDRRAARPPAGSYDVYLVSRESFAARVLGRRAVEVLPGAQTAIKWPAGPAGPASEPASALEGTAIARCRWDEDALSTLRSASDFWRLLTPVVTVLGPDGAPAAVAAAKPPRLKEMLEALSRGDAKTACALSDSAPRPWRIEGLAPGRYAVRAESYGRPPKERVLSYSERWEVDFDAP